VTTAEQPPPEGEKQPPQATSTDDSGTRDKEAEDENTAADD
jgi:hypothetical protein